MSDRRSLALRTAGSSRLRYMLFGLLLIAAVPAAAQDKPSGEDEKIAQSLAEMLRDARAIISNNQERINNPNIGDKGLTGEVVLDRGGAGTIQQRHRCGPERRSIPPSRHGRLMRAMMDAIGEVMDANQSTINAKGIGFKAFIPAVFGRLVGEAFARLAKGEAEIKVTAPPELVRNRKARPDAWEAERSSRQSCSTRAGRAASPIRRWPRPRAGPPIASWCRNITPNSCLTCHGSPKGEMDITGYPKEGGKIGDLGGVISITLYR